ncbi:hypothetical protein [Nocardia phage NS-I]|nr:hypothetical protein [Nocardia phage NS-I]
MSKILARVGALLIAGLAAATVAGCSGGDGSRAGESQFPTTAKASELAPSAASQARADVADAADLSEYPVEIQVYTSMANDLWKSGQLKLSAVTTTAIKADILANYGITLTDDEAAEIRRAILS